MTFCEHCNDSGEVETKVQHQNRPTEHVMCPECPRCDNEGCGMRIEQGDNPGRFDDGWVCSPECGIIVLSGGAFIEAAETNDLWEAVNALEQLERAGNPDPQDRLLLARMCALIAAQVEKKAYRATVRPLKAMSQAAPLKKFLHFPPQGGAA